MKVPSNLTCVKSILASDNFYDGDGDAYFKLSVELAKQYGERLIDSDYTYRCYRKNVATCDTAVTAASFYAGTATDFTCLLVPKDTSIEDIDKIISDIKLGTFLGG